MNDLSLAWRNIWRHPRRSILTMMAIGFAALLLVFMLSFQFGAYEDMINASVKLATGHLQVQGKGYNEKPEIRNTVRNPAAVIKTLSENKGVLAVTPRSQSFVLASSEHRTRGVVLQGVDPVREARIFTLPSLIRKGNYLTPEKTGGVTIGSLLAQRLKLGTGDEITLLGQSLDGSIAATVVTVSGIFKSGIDAVDRSTIQMLITDFDELFSMNGSVHTVVGTVRDLKQAGNIKKALRQEKALGSLSVLDWIDLSPGLKQSIQMDLMGGIIMYLILIIVVAFSILNTFIMAVFERTREFGVMMAIGTSPGRLVKVMLMESMFMTLTGLLSGMILGSLLTIYFSRVGISMGGASELMTQFGISGRLYPRLSLLSLLTGPAIIGVVTFFTATVPALKITRLSPVDAMKSV